MSPGSNGRGKELAEYIDGQTLKHLIALGAGESCGCMMCAAKDTQSVGNSAERLRLEGTERLQPPPVGQTRQ